MFNLLLEFMLNVANVLCFKATLMVNADNCLSQSSSEIFNTLLHWIIFNWNFGWYSLFNMPTHKYISNTMKVFIMIIYRLFGSFCILILGLSWTLASTLTLFATALYFRLIPFRTHLGSSAAVNLSKTAVALPLIEEGATMSSPREQLSPGLDH